MINDTSGETTKVTPSPQTAGSCQKKFISSNQDSEEMLRIQNLACEHKHEKANSSHPNEASHLSKDRYCVPLLS